MTTNEELGLNVDGMVSSGNRREIKRFKVTEGQHVFRILPPFGTNHNNVPSRQVQLHWGFQKKDGSQSPVPCSYPHEGHCPICDMVKEREAMAERAKAQGETEESTQILKDAARFKVRRSYLLNAANQAGEVGILELTKTSIDALVDLMKQYINKYGKNPTSLTTGCWFVFSRSGKGFLNTEYKVEFLKKMVTVDGEQLEKIDTSALSPNISENYDKLGYDIHKMYSPIPSKDLKRILEGAPVDEVVVKQKPQGEQQPQQATTAAKTNAAAATTATAAKPKAEKKAAAPKAAPAPAPADEDVDDIMSILNS